MSYHEVTKDLAITKAILQRKRMEVERDRETYRKAAYKKAVRLLDSAAQHIQDRWNQINLIWDNLVGEVREQTPKAVSARIRKARAKHVKSIEKNKLREKRTSYHLDEAVILNMKTATKPKKWRYV